MDMTYEIDDMEYLHIIYSEKYCIYWCNILLFCNKNKEMLDLMSFALVFGHYFMYDYLSCKNFLRYI